MHRMNNPPELEDAIQAIVGYLRRGGRPSDHSPYGYGFWLPNAIMAFLADAGVPQREHEQRLSPLSPVFYAAAWELCRKGVLRPGIRREGLQSTDSGHAGNGYSVTPFGEEWLKGAAQADYVPVDPSRFGRMLADIGARFGPGFVERSQEAVKCYGTQAYLAACAMCGAAAESIVLALAVAKSGDEKRVLSDYLGSGGRGWVERFLIGSRSKQVQDEFQRYVGLLKYWRDSAAHGRAAAITELEAYTSLVLLLRFAIFASERWAELAGTS